MRTFFSLALLMALLCSPLLAQDDDAYRKVESKLESTTLDSFVLDDTDVKDAVKQIAKKAGVNILFDKNALDDLDADERSLTMELADVTAANALNLVLEQTGLTKGFKHGFLYVMAPGESKQENQTKIYDVRDITAKVKNFEGPKLRLSGDQNDLVGINDYFKDLERDELEADDIEALIEDSVDADWGDGCSVKVVKGQLIVRAPRDVQKQVSSLLDQLRAGK
ncbi:MAG: hypothetical protein KDB82_13820 [Planctomycetes bacterium]|nr:hypothetical protein [Planctomycetota bacterium]